jgi:carbon monoxide dehydrogenase subunit G
MNDKNPPAEDAGVRKRSLKTILMSILLGLIVVIGAFCVLVTTRPNEMKVSRTATMKATPAAVFEQVNDFHKWDAWSPWAKMDPNAKVTFEGPTSGKDAKHTWAGNSDVGEGSMTIVESEPNDHVRIKLDFIKPFAGTNDVLMKIEPKGDETQLTWSMAGEMNFITKAVGMFMDCDKMIGDQFDKGLANMKGIVESQPQH